MNLFTFAAFVFCLTLLVCFYFEDQINLHLLPPFVRAVFRCEARIRNVPLSTFEPLLRFERQRAAGLSGFDLEGNTAGDSRQGLDERAAEEIAKTMRETTVTFDEARLIRPKEHLLTDGIDLNTGIPLDSKARNAL